MARIIETREVTETVTVTNRTSKVEVLCDKSTVNYKIIFHREQVSESPSNGKLLVAQLNPIERNLLDVHTQEITVGEVTLTVAQIAAFVSAVADVWEEEEETEEEV